MEFLEKAVLLVPELAIFAFMGWRVLIVLDKKDKLRQQELEQFRKMISEMHDSNEIARRKSRGVIRANNRHLCENTLATKELVSVIRTNLFGSPRVVRTELQPKEKVE